MSFNKPGMKQRICLFLIFMIITGMSSYAQPKHVDIIVQGGLIVTMDAGRRVIDDGWIAVQDGRIVAVGARDTLAGRFTASQIIEAAGKVVIPGLINTHTHIPMTLFRGIADDLDLHQWLTEYIFPAEARNVTEDFVRAGTRLGLAELIRGGVTTYCDMYYFEDAIAEETAKAGVRGVLGQSVIDFPAPDHKTPEEALSYARTFIQKWKGHPLIIPALAPHAPYTLAPEHLKHARRLSDELDVPVVIHVSETQEEVVRITKQYGAAPVKYLAGIGLLGSKIIAAHVVHVSGEEIDLLHRAGTGVAHNPQSNMKLASGVAPVPEMLAKGIAVGLGTDGAASNNDLNLWEEMDAAAKLHKVMTGDPRILPAMQVFEMATSGGARALHIDHITGSIEPGKCADIVIVSLDEAHQYPGYNVYSTLVYTTKASDVQTVMINGVMVMKDRNLLTLDEAAIKKEAGHYRRQILNSLK